MKDRLLFLSQSMTLALNHQGVIQKSVEDRGGKDILAAE
jgi:hypothetical protein